jgi:lipopolysaccharide transport system permease protein/teichoic acid transport system permease protein
MREFLKTIILQRRIIWSLAKSDFRSRYLGSVLGILWAFLLPLLNLGIMWFAFQQGFKSSPIKGLPFILWLVTGMFPWTFFAEAVQNASNCIVEKSFLVKKVVFDVELLPLIKIFASAILFGFLSLVMLLLFLVYGYGPDKYWLQLPYYAFCLCLLILSVSWLTSAVVVFYSDLGQVITMLLQLGFWVTPIFWSPENLPEDFKFIIFLNPVNYVVSGYRDSLISKVWFWELPLQTLFFWLFFLVFSFFGLFVFKRLRPHFADVL